MAVAYLNLETVVRGLGFTQDKNGVEYVKWERVKDAYIPENIFYRLACAACANANASLMGG